MTPRVRIELVPAPAITAGIVNTPVPMMLPMTSAVADGSPRARARRSAGEAAGIDSLRVLGGESVMACSSCRSVWSDQADFPLMPSHPSLIRLLDRHRAEQA